MGTEIFKLELGDKVISVDNLYLTGTTLNIDFTTKNSGQQTVSQELFAIEAASIEDNVQNYNELITIQNPDLYQYAYVRESQGTAWLPGNIGGSYYGSGLYMWDGTTWIEDDTEVFNQLQTLIENQNLEIQQRIDSDSLLENRIISLENEDHILFDTLPNLP